MSKGNPAPKVQPKDPRQIDLEDWLMQDEYTTPVSDKIKATLHRLLESNPELTQKDQDFIIRHEKTHETYAAMRKILKETK